MTEFLAWKRSPDSFFGTTDPTVERLRKPWPADAPDELIETSYFGFSIPEEKLECTIYHWFHPTFNVASGGLFIFRGFRPNQMNADYHDFRNFQRLPDDITDCTYADGITVRMIRPLEEFEISFDDPATSTSLRLRTRAIMPAAFRPVGGHFTQAMKNTGVLVLRGREYKIDSYFSRDRSWGDPRSERRFDIAPIGWNAGVFDDNFAFHITAFDSPELNPSIAKRYPGLEGGKNCIWGYVWRDGQLLGVKSCRKLTRREADGVTPAGVELELVDERGREYRIAGTFQARMPFATWPNLPGFVSLTAWNCEGRTGYGDSQEFLYEAFVLENFRE